MAEKYRGEFGSSPCLLDDTLSDPNLLAMWEADIKELSSFPPNDPLYFGDLCKISGVIHVWVSNTWQRIDDINRPRWLGC